MNSLPLSALQIDDSLRQPFAAIWPTVSEVIEKFSSATRAPITVYLENQRVYEPDQALFPNYCKLQFTNPELRKRCNQDETHRIKKGVGGTRENAPKELEYCHAGMRIERRSFSVEGLGVFTILFGAIFTTSDEARQAREAFLMSVRDKEAEFAQELESSLSQASDVAMPEEADVALLDALTATIQSLLSATIGLQSLAINMAHELVLMLTGLGLLTRHLQKAIARTPLSHELARERLDEKLQTVTAEVRLGMFLTRNFLSHSADHRFAALTQSSMELLDLRELVVEMTELYRILGAGKAVAIDTEDLPEIPKIMGHPMEIRRALHNVLSNAVKYSYRSVKDSPRSIRVRARIPYDPRESSRRLALVVENYGLGLSQEELRSAFRAGFRGEQARREQPIGVGIGLTETQKIMRKHDGQAKIRSRFLHEDGEGRATYLTKVELIFPYAHTKS